MKSTAGTGVIVVKGREAQVRYDLVQSGQPGAAVVGQIFGDPATIHDAFYTPGLSLRLENGHCASVVLQTCETSGAADVRVSGEMPWD